MFIISVIAIRSVVKFFVRLDLCSVKLMSKRVQPPQLLYVILEEFGILSGEWLETV